MDARLALFDEIGYRPFILWRAPLLKSINGDRDTLKELFMGLYERRISPYYIFHYTPFTLGRSTYGMKIREGAKLLAGLRRELPGPAFPRYTLFHLEGKHDIPLTEEGNSEFLYEAEQERSFIRFKNWKNNWVTYPDI